MSSAIASAYVEIGATSDALTAGLNQAKSQTVTGLEGILGAAGTAALGTVGSIMALGGAVTSFVSKAIDAEREITLFNFNLERMASHTGMTAERIRGMATDLASLNRVGAGDVRGAMNSLLMFDQVRGENFRAATQAAIDFSQTGMMGAAEAARALGMALQNPEAGMRRLRQMNIVFNREQTQTIRSMMAMGDTASAQAMIMREVSQRTSGLAVVMAGTTSGQLAILQRDIGKIAKEIGGAILPVIAPAITGAVRLIEMFHEAWNELPEPIREVARTVAMLAGGFVAISLLAPVLGFLGAFAGPLGAALAALTGPWGILIAAVGLFVAALASLPDWSGWFADVAAEIDTVIEVIADIGTAIVGAFNQGTTGISFWEWLKEKASDFRELIYDVFAAIADFVKDNSETFITWGAIIGEIAAGAYNLLGVIGTFLKDVVGPAILQVGVFFLQWLTPLGLIIDLTGALGVTWSDVGKFITDVLESLAFAINNYELIASIAWLSIKLYALQTWDSIRNGAVALFYAVIGGWSAVGASLVVIFRGIGTYAIQLTQAIKTAFEGTFSAMGAGLRAIAAGENPLTAFRQALGRSLDDARRQLPEIGNLLQRAGAAGAAEAQRFRDLINAALQNEGNITAETRQRLEELGAELDRRLAAQLARQIARREAGVEGEAQEEEDTEVARKIAVEFKTSGIADMWKQAQGSMNDKMEVVAQQQLNVGRQQLNVLQEIRDRPPVVMPEPAGPARAG